MSLQVAILRILASHGSGRATLDSLNRDIAILTASGAEWSARIRRLAARVPAIDIFGNHYVLRDGDGWEITQAGRDFLARLEAVTQDNLPRARDQAERSEVKRTAGGGLIVVGHRFKNRLHRPGATGRKPDAATGSAQIRRGESVSN